MEYGNIVKLLLEGGMSIGLIAFVIYSGDKREARFNAIIETTLKGLTESVNALKDEAIKGNEIARRTADKLEGGNDKR